MLMTCAPRLSHSLSALWQWTSSSMSRKTWARSKIKSSKCFLSKTTARIESLPLTRTRAKFQRLWSTWPPQVTALLGTGPCTSRSNPLLLCQSVRRSQAVTAAPAVILWCTITSSRHCRLSKTRRCHQMRKEIKSYWRRWSALTNKFYKRLIRFWS